VAGIGTVHRALPRTTPGTDFGLEANGGSGAVCWIHIDGERESRRALGGAHSGIKQVDYQVGLVIEFRSVKADAEAAQDDFDTMIEALKERIRSDRQLGTVGSPSPIFLAGEGEQPGQPDLDVISDLPKLSNSEVWIKGVVRVAVTELVYA
jgi:hypothetical protein